MGFDWNGNGSRDAFDGFMDMKIMDEVSSEDNSTDEIDTDTTYNSDTFSSGPSHYVSHVSNRTYSETVNPNISFQEQLKNSIRSPETVKKERDDYRNSAMLREAEQTLRDIKTALVYKAKEAEYTVENGKTVVTCFCHISQRFMKYKREDNGNQLRENQQTFILFRDPNLVYMTWNNYEIEPKYSSEYWQFLNSLKSLATKENITVEAVVYNGKENKYASFPSKVRNDYSYGWHLCIKATTIISVTSTQNATTTKPPAQKCEGTQQTQENKTGVAMGGKVIYDSSKDSNGTTILKSFGCVACCLGGMILPAMMGAGALGMAIGCFIGVGLGVLILKNT